MRKILVTGGCGFIGSNFIKLYLQENSDSSIVNLDKLTYCGNPRNTESLNSNPNYEFVHGDICDYALVESIMSKNIDGIIHFAAETHVDRSIDNSDIFLNTNVIGTRVLLELAKKHHILRFLHISTDEVYGSVNKGSATEEFPLEPNSPYSAAKAASDLLVRSYWKTYGLPASIVRSSNNYGPFQFPEKVIPLFLTNLIEGKKVPLYGNGHNRREWIHVEDNCRAIKIVFEKGIPGEIYNIGSGYELSNIELTERILKVMGETQDKIQYVEDRLGHDLRYSINTDKIRKLGFSPNWTFEAGLKATSAWYQQNKNWWQPLKKDKFTLK